MTLQTKHRKTCPDCKRGTTHAAFWREWYGLDSTCLGCGRKWADGEWVQLGFYRHARRDNINAARARWKRGIIR